jgi:hypothetical protein
VMACKKHCWMSTKFVANCFVLGSFMLQKLVPVTFGPHVSTEFCAMLHVVCLLGSMCGWFAWAGQKLPKLHPPELQWSVISWAILLYRWNQFDDTVCTTCKSTFLLLVLFQDTVWNIICIVTTDVGSWNCSTY